ncbi:MAG: DUF3127 domain-containing protein [Bacteroidales bacterium]|nr:DUF3127 domain-containing protein [Bacteroidales bacterium]
MQLNGTISLVMPEQSGVSLNGNQWKKRVFVLDTTEQFSKRVAFTLMNGAVNEFPVAVGDNVVVSFDIDSREFNGRWYTDIRAYSVIKQGVAPATPADPFTSGYR